jgi:hypothetical protein
MLSDEHYKAFLNIFIILSDCSPFYPKLYQNSKTQNLQNVQNMKWE